MGSDPVPQARDSRASIHATVILWHPTLRSQMLRSNVVRAPTRLVLTLTSPVGRMPQERGSSPGLLTQILFNKSSWYALIRGI